jgi:O-acetyl-ADP-ribose deacetylase (regulator of RNase III)
MGQGESAHHDDGDDYLGSAYMQQQRRSIMNKPYKSQQEQQLHQISLDDWRRNETEEERLERRKSLYPQKQILTKSDIVNWETMGWNNNESDRKFEVNENVNRRVALLRGDIFSLEIDAVVNAANNSFLGGGGIDGAFHSQTGPLLIRDTAAANGLKTGRAKITKGYNLPARYIIHTAGPTETNHKELTSSYNSILDLAVERGLKSVAMCCVSTGIFGFPLMQATSCALQTVRQYLEKHPDLDIYVIFVMFLAKEEAAYHKLMPDYFPVRHNNNRRPEDPITAEERIKKEQKQAAQELRSKPKDEQPVIVSEPQEMSTQQDISVPDSQIEPVDAVTETNTTNQEQSSVTADQPQSITEQ